MDSKSKTVILNAQQIEQKIQRMTWEIFEKIILKNRLSLRVFNHKGPFFPSD